MRNSYEGIFEAWQTEAIYKRCRAAKYRGQGLDDVVQVIAIELAAFDCAKFSNPKAAFSVAINNQLNHIKDSENTRQGKIDNSTPLSYESGAIEPETTESNGCGIAGDIKQIVAKLPKNHQDVCVMLSKGHRISEIANALRLSRLEVERRIAAIRVQFEASGLTLN